MSVDNLDERVMQYRTLSLPGQPQFGHMGTSYLIGDLHSEVLRLRGELASKQNFADTAVRVGKMWEGKAERLESDRDRYREALIEVKYDDEATQCLSTHARIHLTEALKEQP